MAWRAADSLSIRRFLDLELHEAPPDHSTCLIDVETHRAVFTWVVQQLADAGLVQGQTIGIDATTLEANAALRSIVRRDTGERYDAFLTRLAEVSGIATPTRAELARFDRTRKKKGSNDDWTHPQDPGRQDHADEGRADAPGTHRGTGRRPRDGRGRGRHRAGCRRRRHHDDGRDRDHGGGTDRDRAAGGRRRARVGRGQGVSQQSDAGRPRGPRGASRNRTVAGGTGAARRPLRTAAGSGAPAATGCCGNAGNGSNAPSRICSKPDGCERVHLRGHDNILKRLLCTSVASISGC